MHIILQPVPGDLVIQLRVDQDTLTINGIGQSYPDSEGPTVIEYGERGGVATIQLTDAHTVEIIAPDLPPPAPPIIDHEAEAIAALQAQREGWAVDRWQIKTALGKDRWAAIESFGTSPDAPWGLQTVIADAMVIPRVSQTIDLLAYILGWSDEDVDQLFQAAMTLYA